MILQEIAATRDSPDEIAYDLLHDAAFPDQPIGRPILGTPDSVDRFSPDDLRRFLGSRYCAQKHGPVGSRRRRSRPVRPPR